MAELVVSGLPDSDGIVFKAAPAGMYNARIIGVEQGKTSDKSKHPGAPQIVVTYRLQHDDFGSVQVKGYYQIPTQEMDAEETRRSTSQLKRLWVACGLDTSNPRIDTDDLLHCDVKVQLGVEKYNGNDVNRLGDVLPA